MCNSIRRAAVLAGSLVVVAGNADAAEKVFDQSFTVKPQGLLTVNTDGADIIISGTDGNQVIVHVKVEASQKQIDSLKFSAMPTSEGVAVELLRHEKGGLFNWMSWSGDSHIEVRVPKGYRVDAKTAGGDMRVTDVAGPTRVHTSGGDLDIRGVKGALDGETSGGDVKVESIDGDTRVHTSGGGIRVKGVHGDIEASTSGGGVHLLGIDGKIRANSSGGGVECELVGTNRGISATTSGGAVRLTLPKGVKGDLEASSSGGDVSSDFPVGTTHAREGRLEGPINGGGERIYAHTSGGSVKISSGP